MNAKIVLLALAVLTGVSLFFYGANSHSAGDPSEAEFLRQFFDFKLQFKKQYASLGEVAFRQQVFAATLRKIRLHNADSTKTYWLGINNFSDLTSEERKAKYLAEFPQVANKAKCEGSSRMDSQQDVKIVDWVKAKKVQAVKDQGQCGSCWAFASAGALESAYAIYKKVNVPSISEQELIDCSRDYGNYGCSGGLMSFAFDYIFDHNINSEDLYPYHASDQKCNSDLSDHGEYSLKSCVQIKPNVRDLIKGIRLQPVAVAFYVQDDFFDYAGGVYNPSRCSGHPNHAVLAVGFNLKEKTPYFLIKNSWGTGWGEKGFFKIAVGKDKGTCNISGTDWNYYPTL